MTTLCHPHGVLIEDLKIDARDSVQETYGMTTLCHPHGVLIEDLRIDAQGAV